MKDDWSEVKVNSTKPLCIHCKHVVFPDAPASVQDLSIWARCEAEVETNLVDGSIKLQLCTSQRTSLGKCKSEGILFKPALGVVHG